MTIWPMGLVEGTTALYPYMKQLLGGCFIFWSGYIASQVPDENEEKFWTHTGVYMSMIGLIFMTVVTLEYYPVVWEPFLKEVMNVSGTVKP